MNILPINSQSRLNNSPAFNANLWVDASVKKVVKANSETFANAAKNFDSWLKYDQKHVSKTMYIRENSSMMPNMVFERAEKRLSYAYPHEDNGYEYTEMVKKYEDLEFELDNRKCGFWFDPSSTAEKLLNDFKNMFNYLNKG